MRRYIVSCIFFTSVCLSQNDFVFPLNQNDTWVYEMYSVFDILPQYKSAIKFGNDTLMPNGKTYNRFYTIYYRKEGQKIFQYYDRDSTEFACYDFTKRTGDTVSIVNKGSYSFCVLVRSIDTIPVLGPTYRRVFKFQGGPINDTVVDSLGIFRVMVGTCNWYQLIGATIAGNKYGITTSVASHDEVVPRELTLLYNYPNPFNSTTIFEYSLPIKTAVHIKVFDQLGMEVTTLLDGVQEPGLHRISFDAAALSSGVYFCRITADRWNQAQKLILLK